jgi:hypothetical protein
MEAPRAAGEEAWAQLERLDRLAHSLDSRYSIPGTGIRFGWDSIVGLVPGLGDIAMLAPGAYMWLEAGNLGVPNSVRNRMALNTGIDFMLGTIPLVGDLIDVGFKSHKRNVALIREHLERTRDDVRTASAEPLGPVGQAADTRPELVPPAPSPAPGRSRGPRAHPASQSARSRPTLGDGGSGNGRARASRGNIDGAAERP